MSCWVLLVYASRVWDGGIVNSSARGCKTRGCETVRRLGVKTKTKEWREGGVERERGYPGSTVEWKCEDIDPILTTTVLRTNTVLRSKHPHPRGTGSMYSHAYVSKTTLLLASSLAPTTSCPRLFFQSPESTSLPPHSTGLSLSLLDTALNPLSETSFQPNSLQLSVALNFRHSGPVKTT